MRGQSPGQLVFKTSAVLWLLAMGCANDSSPSRMVESQIPGTPPRHAQGFQWLAGANGQTVLLLIQPRTGERLATVSRWPLSETDKSLLAAWNVPHVEVESSRGFVTSSTTHVHLLHAGAGLAGWKGCTSLKYLREGEVKKFADSSAVQDVQGDGGWNVEAVEALKPGWMVVSPAHDLDQRSWPLIPVTEYLEPTPLGRAEWMIPLAWLAGDSASGAQAFERVEEAYMALQVEASFSGKRVFTGSVADGIWHAPGEDSFVAQWIRDAGGEYALSKRDAKENVELGLESLLEVASKADAWVVVTYDPDTFELADLVAQDPRHEALVAATDEIWVCNTAKADYFGEVVVHPDWVLEDLKRMMAGEQKGPNGLFVRWTPQTTQP